MSAPGPAPGPKPDMAWGKSNSVMFAVYMVIGFSVTLAFIIVVLTTYYLCRYMWQGQETAGQQATPPQGPVLLPKETFLVVHPGGAAEIGYREDEEQVMGKSKEVQLQLATVELTAESFASFAHGMYQLKAKDAHAMELAADQGAADPISAYHGDGQLRTYSAANLGRKHMEAASKVMRIESASVKSQAAQQHWRSWPHVASSHPQHHSPQHGPPAEGQPVQWYGEENQHAPRPRRH
ncbi:hypothetical protein WJX72_005106 [[Myrmecia] bisecta]|uniref:Uncharacterized protein n=1 Tax=[Myrmecia] bisecta TaxID=41462 RepID=A0AAW1PMR2_9CHLO